MKEKKNNLNKRSNKFVWVQIDVWYSFSSFCSNFHLQKKNSQVKLILFPINV